MTKHPNHHLRAVLFALAGFTLWTIADSFMKRASMTGLPKHEIMGIGALTGMAVIFIVTALRGKTKILKPKRYGGIAAIGFMYLFNYVCFIFALSHLPMANYYTVLFLAPIVVAILAAIFLKEHLGWKHLLAIVMGFLGVVIAVNPEQLLSNPDEGIYYGLALIGTCVVALQMLALRVVSQQESRESTAFWPRLVAVIGAAIATPFLGFAPMPFAVVFYAMASGGIGSLGWLAMAAAYKAAPANIVAPIQYSQIISSALLGYLIWGDVPSLHLLAGATVIIVAGIYLVTHTRKSPAILKTEDIP